MKNIKKNIHTIKVIFFFFTALGILTIPHQTFFVLFLAYTGLDYFFAKLAILTIIFRKWDDLKNLSSKYTVKNLTEKIEGVPISELAEHLHQKGTLKAEEVFQKWNIHARKYSALTKRLHEMGVLVRGENNANLTAPNLQKHEIQNLLDTAKEIHFSVPWFPIFRQGKTPLH